MMLSVDRDLNIVSQEPEHRPLRRHRAGIRIGQLYLLIRCSEHDQDDPKDREAERGHATQSCGCTNLFQGRRSAVHLPPRYAVFAGPTQTTAPVTAVPTSGVSQPLKRNRETTTS